MRRPLLVLVLALLAGCSGDEAVQEAEQAVRQACSDAAPAGPGQAATRTDVAEVAAAYEEAADSVAKAALKDPAWNDLSRAYSVLAEGSALLVSLPKLPSGRVAQAEVTPDQAQAIAAIQTDVMEAEATIRAECRKVS